MRHALAIAIFAVLAAGLWGTAGNGHDQLHLALLLAAFVLLAASSPLARRFLHPLLAYDRPHASRNEVAMRVALIIAGIILLAAGIWVTLGNGHYQQTSTLAQLGPAKIEATHDKAVPQWVGIAGIVIGAVLAIGGFASKR